MAGRNLAKFLLIVLACHPAAFAIRGVMPLYEAWTRPDWRIAVIRVARVTPPKGSHEIMLGPDGTVTVRGTGPPPGGKVVYDILVSQWLKPRGANLPMSFALTEKYAATDTASFKAGGEYLVYLSEVNGTFETHREFNLSASDGQQALQGVRRFLEIMYVADPASRVKSCLAAWSDKLSAPEKVCLLDAMWLIGAPEHAPMLRKVALGNDSAQVRGWALTILVKLRVTEGIEELIPILLSDSDYEVKRQALYVLGTYRVQSALPAIEEFLARDQAARYAAWQAAALRSYAAQARDKISGKDPSSSWK
jgi:hypothetical protein